MRGANYMKNFKPPSEYKLEIGRWIWSGAGYIITCVVIVVAFLWIYYSSSPITLINCKEREFRFAGGILQLTGRP